MKLYIDDIRNAPDDSWSVARTVTEAINFISMFGEQIEAISFDHDISYQLELNGVSRPYPSPETFIPVAHYVSEYYVNHNAKDAPYPVCTIHSANPVGCEKIKAILNERDIDAEIHSLPNANRLEMEV